MNTEGTRRGSRRKKRDRKRTTGKKTSNERVGDQKKPRRKKVNHNQAVPGGSASGQKWKATYGSMTVGRRVSRGQKRGKNTRKKEKGHVGAAPRGQGGKKGEQKKTCPGEE